MKRNAFDNFIKTNGLPDEWWVSVGSNVLDNPMSLDEIAQLEYEMPGQEIVVMHTFSADQPDSEWIRFEFEGMERLQKAITTNDNKLDDTLATHLKFEVIAAELCEIRTVIAEFSNAFYKIESLLKDVLAIEQQKKELATRQQFIEAGEEALMHKTLKYEESVAELEQRMEEETDSAERTA